MTMLGFSKNNPVKHNYFYDKKFYFYKYLLHVSNN